VQAKFKDRFSGENLRAKTEKLTHAVKKRNALWLTPEAKRKRGIKVTVRLISNFTRLWERITEQTPNGSCQWGSTLFLGEGDADLYIILNTSTHDPSGTPLPAINFPSPERVWGLHMEPTDYVKLFGYDHPEEHEKASRFYTNCEYLYRQDPMRYIPSPPYILMHVDRSWDFLAKAALPKKTETLTMISSSLKLLAGHKARMKFIDSMVNSQLEFSFWGRGEDFNQYPNYCGFAPTKWDVYAPCKYAIVVENSVAPYYWTEKIADSLLSYTLPFYHGSPNVHEYLPEDCYIPIDINDPYCADKIAEAIQSGEYEKRLPAIIEARQKILHKQNLFAFLDREVNAFFGK
jgi:hypothetical protein